ncbi:MAG: single-stranded-DNA-specific exonuclease RecJ [Gammaproteobacteria bacterium]|nr:single-stranded-DNA-specific exonuclease RecJ [Gammaproteobacteria bacterium]
MEIRRRDIPDLDLPADIHPLLRRLYAARQVKDAAELDYALQQLIPPTALANIDAAATLLERHLDQRILIVGDFDADGATSSALGILGLKALGATHVDYLVPDRFTYGYGLTPEIVGLARERQPDLIITVDNGISSIAGVAAAKAAGIRVLVTDHHLAGAELPDADVIVNPNQPGCDFPSKSLAGVGVMFYVLLALRAQLRENGMDDAPNLASLLDLVALGTVADVVPLDANNRRLVHHGLLRIRGNACRPGIRALLEVAGRTQASVTATDLGFAVGPRLNAAGRLEDMSIGIECLLADDYSRALALARQLDELNRARRDIEAGMQEEALRAIDDIHLDGNELPLALCLHDTHWHQGVVGLVASRIKERYHRPVIAFAPEEGGETLKGSARSVPGVHMRDVLDAVATRHPGLVTKFGGHAMAAGLSLPAARLGDFEQALNDEIARWVDADALRGVLQSDGELEPDWLSLDAAELLRDGGPWGQGFPEPQFDGEFEIVTRRIVGEKHLKLRLRVPGDGRQLDAIAFNEDGAELPPGEGRVRAVYRLDVNEFRGMRSAQLVIEHIEAA